MTCPLCGQRKARRGCPALGKEICSVCCGTKRLTEIKCPDDCPYLSTAREHPPAPVLRRQQLDVSQLLQAMRDLSEGQSQLFLMVGAFLIGYESPTLHTVIDEDVAEAVGALAATFETASKGLIYEHRSSSRPAEELSAALKPLFEEARGKGVASGFDRDAAVVLRRVEEAVKQSATAGNRRGFIELLARVIGRRPAAEGRPSDEPRLIVP